LLNEDTRIQHRHLSRGAERPDEAAPVNQFLIPEYRGEYTGQARSQV